jgi:hypothetical protein
VVAAIDPCFSCTDRMIAVARPAGDEMATWEQVRQHGIEWYRRERGVDFADLNRKFRAGRAALEARN